MRKPANLIWLILLWIMLWGSLTFANVVGGIVVAIVVTLFVGRSRTTPIRVRPLGAVQFLAVSAQLLIASTFDTIAAIARPSTVRSAVIAVKMRTDDDVVVTAVANTVTLTPGTMTLAVTDPPVSLYIHVLRFSDRAAVERDVRRLEMAAARSLGVTLARPDPSVAP